MEQVNQAIILAGGLGTRFLPATKAVSKELFPIGNRPALLYLLKEVYDSGIRRVCIVTSKKKKKPFETLLSHDKNLEESLKNLNRLEYLKELNTYIDEMDITILVQGKLNGSGGALYTAKKWAQSKPFVLLCGDDVFVAEEGQKPVTAQLLDVYNKTGKFVISVRKMPIEVVPRYSCVVKGKKIDEQTFEAKDIIEKPKNPKSDLVGLAKYVATPDIFDYIPSLPRFENGEIRMTDAVQKIAQKGGAVSYEFNAKYYDCGNKLEFAKCVVDSILADESIKENFVEFLKERVTKTKKK